jgi:transcriptional regulator NrdR family protein
MKCPACSGNHEAVKVGTLKVQRTRDIGVLDEYGAAVERDRACPVCGYKFVTIEVDAEFFHLIRNRKMQLEAEVGKLAERVAKLENEPYFDEHAPKPRDSW